MGLRMNVTQRPPSSDKMLVWKDDYPICVANAKKCSDHGEDDFKRARQDYFREMTYHEITNYEVVDKHYNLDLGSYISTVELAKHLDYEDF